MIEVWVGPEKDSIQVTLGGMIEVAVDQDQDLKQVPTEIELDALGVGNMITFPKIIRMCHTQKKTNVADAWLRRGQDSIESSCDRCLWKFD